MSYDFLSESDAISLEPQAKLVTDALFTLLDAKAALAKAEKNVPSYTGNNSHESYYANEQQKFNIAANEFTAVIKSCVSK